MHMVVVRMGCVAIDHCQLRASNHQLFRDTPSSFDTLRPLSLMPALSVRNTPSSVDMVWKVCQTEKKFSPTQKNITHLHPPPPPLPPPFDFYIYIYRNTQQSWVASRQGCVTWCSWLKTYPNSTGVWVQLNLSTILWL